MFPFVQKRQIAREVRQELGQNASSTNKAFRPRQSCERQIDTRNVNDSNNFREGPGTQLPRGCRYIGTKGNETDSSGESSPSRHGGCEAIIVDNEGEDDAINPKNWSLFRKVWATTLLGILIFVQAWAGAADSIANAPASRDFHVSPTVQQLDTAMFLIGVGSGALFAGPMSDTVGRNPTYLVASMCFLCFTLGTALVKSFAGFVVLRYLVGLSCSATLSINGASVQDMFDGSSRGIVFPFIAWVNVVPPMLAPLASGSLVNDMEISWRWTEWTTLIISTAAFLLALLFMPETYLPRLLDWRARILRQETSNDNFVSEFSQRESFVERARKNIPMPLKLFATDIIIAVLGSYLTLLYILLFTFLSGFDYIFKKTYDLSTAGEGYCFAAVALGSTVAVLAAPLCLLFLQQQTKRVTGDEPCERPPEDRLWAAIVASPLLPASLFMLGWTARPDIPIYVPLTACFLFGIVLIAMYVSSYQYIIDSYPTEAAVALASITMVRYLVAAGMVMAVRKMYESMGVAWVLTFLGILGTLLMPAPFIFWWFGSRLRQKSKFAQAEDDEDEKGSNGDGSQSPA